MGKPFEQELAKIPETLNYVLECDITLLKRSIAISLTKPLFIVGSGGSLSACYFAETLHQSKGMFSKALTPLESFNLIKDNSEANVMFLSASGRNKDILFAFDQFLNKEPEQIINICTSSKSPLSARSAKYSLVKTFEFPLPSGKDGFLASNSLIAFFVLLARAYNFSLTSENFIKTLSAKWEQQVIALLDHIELKNSVFHILYSGWSKPVAVDLESKFTESALSASLLADYRNFGHGRHHWFDKKKVNSVIIALITPNEKLLAEKTLAILPKNIPVIRIESTHSGPTATIDLLIKSFYLVNILGKLQDIDPGKPGVPAYGSKLYHLSYTSLLGKPTFPKKASHLFIQRKIKPLSINSLSKVEIGKWEKNLSIFTKTLATAKFGGVILDYDRTLCGDEHRFTGITNEMQNELIKILRTGFMIGIVTGRGQSLRKDLQNCIPKKYWKNLLVGYYNGAEIGELSDNTLPKTSGKVDPAFDQIQNLIMQTSISDHIEITTRPLQLTIESTNYDVWESVKSIIYQNAMLVRDRNFLMLESSRSIDIIKRPDVSKLNMVEAMKAQLNIRKLPQDCLCIGDKGKWPGNDFELLNTVYSLSVNEVSLDPATCWNLAPLGVRNADACLLYLRSLKISEGYIKLVI